jgi:hypothetical protein
MADPLVIMPSSDPQDFVRAADFARTYGTFSDDLAFDVVARDARLTERLGGAIVWSEASGFDRDVRQMTGYSEMISPDQANADYGLEGYLSFDKPVLPGDAAFRLKMAKERQFRDQVMSRSDLGFLGTLGAGAYGAVTDPVGLPLLFAPELLGIGKAAQGGWAALSAGRAGLASGRAANAGRMAVEGALEGVVGGAMYEGVNAWSRLATGEEYTFGDATRNILTGAVLGAAFGGVVGAVLPPGGRRVVNDTADEAAEGVAAAAIADAPTPVRLPREVEAMPQEARAGALALAIERAIDDAPVDVGRLIERERTATLSRLDEVDDLSGEMIEGGGVIPARWLEADVAVTTRGTEIPVRYALVELDSLTTSHDVDMSRNPDFPGELQPRDRERAGAVARNIALEQELNPKRLMREAGAESGAPIVSRDGVVESGNGRTIALKRSAETGGAAWDRYRAELEAQGFDLEGFEQPALVRVRTAAMTGEERAALASEMNADVTERLGPTEQAMADADAIDGAMLALLQGDDPFAAGNRAFQRAFIDRVAADQLNIMVGEGGHLSSPGRTRIMAALVAAAYRDTRLVEALFETGENNIKTVGQALAASAPAWSRMRAAVAGGRAPADLDLTANLRSAVDLIRHARDSGGDLGELVALRTASADMFSGEIMAPETEAFLQLIFRRNKDGSPNWKQQRSGQRIAEGLIAYARRVEDAQPGGELFGGPTDGNARAIIAEVLDWIGRQSEEQSGDLLERLRAEPAVDAASGPPRAPADAGGDVQRPVVERDRSGGGGGRQAGGDQAGSGGDAGRDAGQAEGVARTFVPRDQLAAVEPRLELPNPTKGWQGSPLAEIELGQLSDGRWTWRGGYTLRNGSGSSRPFDAAGFATREEALAAAIAKLRGVAGREGPDVAKVLAWLDGLDGGAPAQAKAAAPAAPEILDMPAKGRAKARIAVRQLDDGTWRADYSAEHAKSSINAWTPPQTSREAAMADAVRRIREVLVERDGAAGAPIGRWLDQVAADTAPAAPGMAEDAAPAPSPIEALIASDPELKALADQTEAMILADGLSIETAAKDRPDVAAELIRAAAFCLSENGGLE